MGRLQHIDYKFLVKGHTKNACDRDFGLILKHNSTKDIWTMDHLVEAIEAAARKATTVHVPRGSDFFKTYKEVLTELFESLDGIQQLQVFSMDCAQLGVVSCRKGPEASVVEKDVRRKIDGIWAPKEKVIRMMTEHIETLPPLPPKAEKMAQMYQTIRPYVPVEFRNDPVYEKPSTQQDANAKTTKKA
ncbi:hypothetical protein PC128_g11371 [Phytophthora cactorum]|nr:hypothetical protein PC128_g11371 [Phytophthora cactorum]